MKPRTIITITLLACLLVSAPVWAQGQQPVCPCWTAEQLEEGVSTVCLDGEVSICGLSTEPGSVQSTEVRCSQGPDFFFARTATPLGASDQPPSCEFLLSIPLEVSEHFSALITQAEASACRADLLRLCAELNP